MTAHPYTGKRIVLTSKHAKLKLIKPALDQYLECDLFEESLDTDQLGTFSGEIERTAPPRETAILKARLGMKSTGLKLGVASEGSVSPDPVIPFVNSNIEHLVLVDDENDIVISEVYRSFDITVATVTTSPGKDISEFLHTADFPNHGLIVRPNAEKKSDCIKGIRDLESLTNAIASCSRISADGLVVIESDLRAHFSPSRQKNIVAVANQLAARASRLCPSCQMPGWGRSAYEKGLKCSTCKLENPDAIRQAKTSCDNCNHTELGQIIATQLDPANCQFCNP